MNLRVIGGGLRGKKLHSVPGEGLTRPTANRVREAVFNILGQEVNETRVLELFAGTGILGLEALSRGAQSVVFVDNHPLPLSVIRKNIAACGYAAAAQVFRVDLAGAFHWPVSAGGEFQLVFMDPPYDKGLVTPTLLRLHTVRVLSEDALITVEHSPREPIGEEAILPFRLKDQRKYGKTLVSFLRYVL